MANGRGLFSRNSRSVKRKEFSSILETFTKVQDELEEFVTEKNGHIRRIDGEITTLSCEKVSAVKEQTRAKKIADKLGNFLGDSE